MEQYVLSQGLFIRLLGVIYFGAFWSLYPQIKGLFGANGISPIRNYLLEIEEYVGEKIYFQYPTIFWWKSDDSFLTGCALLGMVSSAMVMVGIYPSLFLLICCGLYLSYCSVGAVFLSFQWDALLNEVGFVAIFFALMSPPPFMMVLALWFLLFRLMFSSGITKLMWGSREWKDLTAMDYHYETQPLPTVLGYFAHQQPKWMAKLSVIGVYFLELVVPFLIFLPGSMKVLAFFLLAIFQLLIILTGNYAFFNWLTIVMCVPLLPDRYLAEWMAITPLFSGSLVMYGLLSVVGGAFIFFNVLELVGMFTTVGRLKIVLWFMRRFQILNPYGLFVHMTTRRDEIVIEGSDDHETWKAYTFKWKPGDLKERPKLIAPHQPRLDWQMWFASLSFYEQNPWFGHLLYRLLEGREDVLKLFKENPFPDHPPTFIRASLYQYQFTDLKTWWKTGAWWKRVYVQQYSKILTLN